MALVTTMRFINDPSGGKAPPVLYVPFVTSTVSPASAASIADWMFVAALAQVLKGATCPPVGET